MEKMKGFTLIEVIIFIVLTGLLGSALFIALIVSSQKMPSIAQQTIALQTARQCMEWFISQRQLNGFSALTCPDTITPSFCSAPAGYAIATQISCTTLNTDTQYKTLTVTVSGAGNTSLSTLIAGY